MAGILSALIISVISFSVSALTQTEVLKQSPAYHLLKDIYTVINGEYIPLNTSSGKINSSLMEITGNIDMKGYDIENVGNIKIKSSSGNFEWLLENGIIKEKFLPYCPQEITSDVYTNGQNPQTGCNFGGYVGYYNITALKPENVRKGVIFGRGEIGTLEPGTNPWEECKVKTEYDVKILDDNCHCMYSDLGYKFLVCKAAEECYGCICDYDNYHPDKCEQVTICACDYTGPDYWDFWGLECPWPEDPRNKTNVAIIKNEDTDKSCNQICSNLGVGWSCASVGLDTSALNSLCWDKYHGESWVCSCSTTVSSAWTNCRCVKD